MGYTGGDVPDATYRNHGTHAGGIEVIFDPELTSYRNILEFFFQIHDPTTKNRQGNDRRLSPPVCHLLRGVEQKHVAEETIADVDASGWNGPVVTEVEPTGTSGRLSQSARTICRNSLMGLSLPRADWILPKRKNADEK